MGLLFKAKEMPRLQEGLKLVGNEVVRKAVSYSELKKCVMKKELGDTTESCREIFKELNIKEI